MEREDYGIQFGLSLHFDFHLPLPKVVRITQAASKKYHHTRDAYESKLLLYDPYHKAQGGSAQKFKYRCVLVPRIAPPVPQSWRRLSSRSRSGSA